MSYIYQLGIICGASFAGELLHAVIPLPIPASVYGLIVMLVLLCTGIVKLEQVEKTSDYLLAIMPLFFLPPSVALMESFDAIQGSVLALLLVCFISTVLVIIATGLSAQAVIRVNRGRESVKAPQSEQVTSGKIAQPVQTVVKSQKKDGAVDKKQ